MYYFHLEKVFSNRDINGNVYSFLKITCNKNGNVLYCYDQGKNGSHYLRTFFDTWGKWSESERWEKIRDFDREVKHIKKIQDKYYLTEENIHSWLKKNHRIRRVKTKTLA